MSDMIFNLPCASASRAPDAEALKVGIRSCTYGTFAGQIDGFGRGLVANSLGRLERVAVYADKSIEAVAALFGAAQAGGVFVPVNPLLKPNQVAYVLRDCNVVALVTTAVRLRSLRHVLADSPDLRLVVLLDATETDVELDNARPLRIVGFDALVDCTDRSAVHRTIDADMAAILYTSGSTGSPKGVVLSHRNLVAGARSVASYLENHSGDRILAVLPLSFDYGLSQVTTGFLAGASVVLHNHLLPADTVRVLAAERITGLAAVPPLWMQLTAFEWPASIDGHLRYFTNSGGVLPPHTLQQLRQRVPSARPFLMYGLTEAFRSTYLPPEEIERRPTSIGKAIPNAEVLVVREDGSECAPDEPGELVHRGALVSMGYWNDQARTAERFRPAPCQLPGLTLPEQAVWSGDTVRRDAEGFLYFVGRRDEMIKTSGYRVSPTEVEEAVFRTGLVSEAVAFGLPHPTLGEAIALVALSRTAGFADTQALLAACREFLPGFMLPLHVEWASESLQRNANGKIDRKYLADQRRELFTSPIGQEQKADH